jgi:hypothetical protein
MFHLLQTILEITLMTGRLKIKEVAAMKKAMSASTANPKISVLQPTSSSKTQSSTPKRTIERTHFREQLKRRYNQNRRSAVADVGRLKKSNLVSKRELDHYPLKSITTNLTKQIDVKGIDDKILKFKKSPRGKLILKKR